jgi:hypothetical protein
MDTYTVKCEAISECRSDNHVGRRVLMNAEN